ncbi:MAG TPA: phosphatase PAP2 family protein, partial [Steroidobacteraceae bacterium]|nr:phosphatase PAP2 family protein [Steroidobacteraceae bacterium]
MGCGGRVVGQAEFIVGRLKQYPILGWTSTRASLLFEYVGVIAILGFIAAACATVAFFEIADEIGVSESLSAFDVALSESLRRWVSREVLELFALITRLGDVEVLFGISLVVLTVLILQRRWLLSAGWAIAAASGGLLNRLLKSIFERTRPVHDHGLIAETNWSFPSGHASGSLLIFGLLTYLLVRHVRRPLHLPISLLGMTIVVFVGSSRVVLNVHYFSDVLAGFVSAAAWVAIS